MAFNTKHNLFSFPCAAATVKQWRLGWTVEEAARSANRQHQSDTRSTQTPGAYAVLVGFGRR